MAKCRRRHKRWNNRILQTCLKRFQHYLDQFHPPEIERYSNSHILGFATRGEDYGELPSPGATAQSDTPILVPNPGLLKKRLIIAGPGHGRTQTLLEDLADRVELT
jgi:hypothetical protein